MVFKLDNVNTYKVKEKHTQMVCLTQYKQFLRKENPKYLSLSQAEFFITKAERSQSRLLRRRQRGNGGFLI